MRFLRQNFGKTRLILSKFSSVADPAVKPEVSGILTSRVSKVEKNDQDNAHWIQFGQYEKGLLSHLTKSEIIRALFILKVCSYDFIVDRSLQLFDMAKKFGNFGDLIMRRTFFNQFVGGDEVNSMTKVSDGMKNRGISLMLVPVLEESPDENSFANKIFDENLESILGISELCAKCGNDAPLFQLKVSALIPPKILEKIAQIINKRCVTRPGELESIILSISSGLNDKNFTFEGLNDEENRYFATGLVRIDNFVSETLQRDVKILVDAEFHSCQLAISSIACALMAKYNQKSARIGNTIQAYLKDAEKTASNEIDLITNNMGLNWFGKVVRGAYMDRERLLAKKNMTESPICDTYEDTNKSYNRIITQIISNIAQNKDQKSHLVVASHNEGSIRLAAQKMKDFGISRENDEIVSFAQIYGMADYLSLPLTKEGYRVYKSTPYGPLDRVLPYLARRASENRSVIKGARKERDMLTRELRQRFLRF